MSAVTVIRGIQRQLLTKPNGILSSTYQSILPLHRSGSSWSSKNYYTRGTLITAVTLTGALASGITYYNFQKRRETRETDTTRYDDRWSSRPDDDNNNNDNKITALPEARVVEKPVRCRPPKIAPKVNPKDYRLEVIVDENVKKTFDLDEIKRYPRHSIKSAVPCKTDKKSEKSLDGNIPTWTGVRLNHILRDLDVDGSLYDRVELKCLDSGTLGAYNTIVPIREDIVLAYEMDGVELTPEHGYPIRVLVTSLPGARNVKWLQTIILKRRSSNDH